MKKKFLAIALMFIMATGTIAGCGKSAEKDISGEVDTNIEKDEEKQEASDDSNDTEEKPEITVWGWDAGFNGLAIEEAAKLYDGATVKFEEMGKADALTKLHTTLASGVTDDLPEIVLISDLNVQGYIMSYPDAFMPLGDLIDYNDFPDFKTAVGTYEGVEYSVPFDSGATGLFYRTDYMEEIGYTKEDMQDLTWDEFLSMGEKLKEKGHLLQTYNPDDVSDLQIILQSAGKWFTDEDGNVDFVNNDALKEGLSILDRLNKSDFVKVVSDWGEFTSGFNSGDVATVIRGSWISSAVMDAEDQSGKWAVAPIPKLNVAGATNKSNQGGSSWFVLKGSENAEVAADFLAKTFAGNKDLYNTLLTHNIMGTYLPASDVEMYDLEQDFYGGQKLNADLASWLDEIPAVNTGAFSAEAQSALQGVLQKYLSGGDLDECLEEAEKQYEQLIQ